MKTHGKNRSHAVSYRMLSALLVTVALLLLCVSLFVRYRFYVRYDPLFTRHAGLIDELMALQENARYTVRIFDNIETQLKLYEQMDDQRFQKLKTAYAEKRELFSSNLQSMSGIADQLRLDSIAFRKISRYLPFGLEPEYANQIQTVFLSLSDMSQAISNSLPDPDFFQNIDMEDLNRRVEPLGAELKALRDMTDRQSSLHNSRFYRFVEYSMGTLFLLMMLFAFLVRRILQVGVGYAEKSIDLLSRHEYDLSRLPTVNSRFREEKELVRQMGAVLEEQAFLEEVKNAAGRGYVIEDVMENLFRHIRERMPVDRIDLLRINPDNSTASTVSTVMKEYSVPIQQNQTYDLAEGPMKKCLDNEKAVIVKDLEVELGDGEPPGGLAQVFRQGIRSVMILPLFLNGFLYAFLVFGSVKTAQYGMQEEQLGKNIAREISALLEKTLLTKTMFSKLATSFAELVDRKDIETGFHIQRMVAYATLIAQELVTHSDPEYKLNPQVVRDIENNAAIHDIGKVAIPDVILKKPGKLDEAEWEIMRTHTSVGADILHEIRDELEIFRQNFYEVAENIARYHHERWDGKGYPEGLQGCGIPLEARIVAVADVFDAVSSKRAYKEPWPLDDTFSELENISGTHLDPVLVSLFLSKKMEIREIYNRLL